MSRDSGQASLVKVVIGLALVALLLFDLGRPAVARVQLDTRAREVAFASSETLRRTRDEDAARVAADEQAAVAGAVVVAWSARPHDLAVTVTIAKPIDSWVFGRFMKGWYDVNATATERSGS